jgi:hypothetical protein
MRFYAVFAPALAVSTDVEKIKADNIEISRQLNLTLSSFLNADTLQFVAAFCVKIRERCNVLKCLPV